MEKNSYLNKAIQQAKETLELANEQKQSFENSISELTTIVEQNGGDSDIIEQMQKAAQDKDLKKLKELSNKIKR